MRIDKELLIGALLISSVSPAFAQFTLNGEQKAWVEETFRKMSPDEKIGQVMFAVTPAYFLNTESDDFKQIRENIQTYHVGGYHVAGGDPATAYLLISRMQGLAKVPLLITADLEGGAGYQFTGASRFPRGMAIGATGNPDYAFQAATFSAKEARAIGIRVNFYPVVDVNNNPQNPIINIRSFGENAAKVGEFAAAYIRGTQSERVMATAKHFPGHGDTSVDSHLELPVLNFDRARLNEIELAPYRAAFASEVGAVMTAHIFLPQLEKTPGVPASLSRSVTTDLLRRELGFHGLIFTDALPMHAITTNFGAEQAVVMAVEAGADVALEPVDVPKSFAALKEALASGRIAQAQLDDSVRRILTAKAWAGLDRERLPSFNLIDSVVGSRAAQQKSQEIMEHALTLVKDDKNALPLRLANDDGAIVVNIVDAGDAENAPNAGLTFRNEFISRHPKTLFVSVTPATSKPEAELIERVSRSYRAVVVSCSIRIASYKGAVGLTEVQQNLLKGFAQHDGPFVFALFGSPYLLNSIPELPSYALAYEFYPGAETAMVRAIFGEIPFEGRLPVTVGDFPPGFRLEKPGPP